MKNVIYPYVKYLATSPKIKPAQYVYRPVIPVHLSFGTKTIVFDGLVDSGAGDCTFPGWIAKALGHNLYRGVKRVFRGIGGYVVAYQHKTYLSLPDGSKYLSNIYYSHKWNEMPFGLLGQIGFFSNFNVSFDYKSKLILIRCKEIK
jgi:hypothetical protein